MATHYVLGDKVRVYQRERGSRWQAATHHEARLKNHLLPFPSVGAGIAPMDWPPNSVANDPPIRLFKTSAPAVRCRHGRRGSPRKFRRNAGVLRTAR